MIFKEKYDSVPAKKAKREVQNKKINKNNKNSRDLFAK